jgi:hypothetical protein
MSFFDKSKIKFQEINEQIKNYLLEKYAQAGDVFSTASPFGQILSVMSSFTNLIFTYLEDAMVESNILTASRTRSIYSFARLAGHNPTRAIAAEGTIGIKWKSSISEVNMTYAIINDRARLTCEDNGLPYILFLNSSSESLKISKTETSIINLKIVQGKYESQRLTGTGEDLQSFNIISKRSICNENVFVFVNGEPFEIVDSLYDMKKGAKQCMVKTGLIDGIDLYFGNADFGYVPPFGATILVEYVNTDGFIGNVFGKSEQIKFKWEDKATTNTGEEIDLNEYLLTSLEKSIVLGSDQESTQITKMIAPKTSRSFVLANPDNYINLLSRFNYSFVDAYTTFNDEYIDDDNIIYLFLVPDIKRRLNKNADYFTTNIVNFYLDPDEKDALLRYINQSGRQMISTELSIVDPILTKYSLNIFIRIYDNVDMVSIKNEINTKMADYLLSVTRRDKIPKSDIVSIIEKIKGIDSVSVSFTSERNEKAINEGFYIQKVNVFDQIRGTYTVIDNKITVPSGTDPNLGLDEFGDIVIGLHEYPVIRGGWYDRFGNFLEDSVSSSSYGSVNIVVKDVIKNTIATQQLIKSKDSLR